MVVQSKFSKIMIPTLSAIIAMILVGGGAVFLAYRAGLFDIVKIPVIKAPEGPVKEEYKERSGVFIPHTNKTVYGSLDNDSEILSSGLEIIPLPEEVPELTSVFIPNQNASKKANELSDTDGINNNSSAIKKIDDNTTFKKNLTLDKNNNEDNKTNDVQEILDNSSSNFIILKPVKRPKSGYYVQLASFNNEGKARKAAKILNEKLAVSLEGHLLKVMSKDLGFDKGIWWRIVTDLFEREKAESICALLKSEGQGCIIRSQ